MLFHNFGKPTLFCFVDGILALLENQRREIQQIEGQFAATPMTQNSWILPFLTLKCLKMKGSELKFFEALIIRFQPKKESRIELQLSRRHKISLGFTSIFQKSKLGLVA